MKNPFATNYYLKEPTSWPLFMGRVELPQGCRATARRQFTLNQ